MSALRFEQCGHQYRRSCAQEGRHGRCSTARRLSVQAFRGDACQRCGEDLTDAACLGHERRTLIDIVFEKVVRHADAQIKHCPRCHAESRARFPHQMPGPLQYGPGIKAYVVHLLIAQMLSLKRVAQSMHALIGRTLSEATLLGYLAQLHHVLAEWERRAIERLLASPAMHVDETSLRVDRKNHWIHVYSAGTLTVKCLHPKRGCEAIEAIAILPRYAGVAVHDCWASYLSYAHCDHALCGAHLLRELAFIGCSSHTDSSRGTLTRKRHHVVRDPDVLTISIGQQGPRLVEA